MDYIMITVAAVGPAVLPFLLVWWAVTKGNPETSRTGTLKLNHSKGLLAQPLFWLSILIPLCYFIEFGLIAWQGYSPSLTAAGLSTFIQISTFPLGLLSVSIPLSVIIASFHSTEQTAQQIRLTHHKNNLESFYTHRNEMFSYFDRIGEQKYIGDFTAEFKIHPRIHKFFFKGEPSSGVPEINEDMFSHIETLLQSARFWISYVITSDNDLESLTIAYLLHACNSIHVLIRDLGLMDANESVVSRGVFIPIIHNGKHEKVLTVGTTATDIIACYRYARSYFINLCDFAGRKYEDMHYDEFKLIEIGMKFLDLKRPDTISVIHSEAIPNWASNIRTIGA